MKRYYPHADEFDRDLEANGISPHKVWELPEAERKLIIAKYYDAASQQVSNRRFNLQVHRMVAAKRKKGFFAWLRTRAYYSDILA